MPAIWRLVVKCNLVNDCSYYFLLTIASSHLNRLRNERNEIKNYHSGKKRNEIGFDSLDVKLDVFSNITEKWQSLIDTVAKIVDVPSGLIMRLNEDTIEVLLKVRRMEIHIMPEKKQT